MECPYCTGPVGFTTSKLFYGNDYGINIYVCYPCDAYVGTHGKGKTPKGTLANKQLRSLRMIAHSIFDHCGRVSFAKWGVLELIY